MGVVIEMPHFTMASFQSAQQSGASSETDGRISSYLYDTVLCKLVVHVQS